MISRTGKCEVIQNTWELGLCDMDKKYISRFFDFFFDFDFNHDFDTNRHALSYTSCFCTFYLFLHILLVLHILFCTFLYSITHFTLYFFFLPIYMLLCALLFTFYIYIYAFSRRFYPKRLTVHSGYNFFVSTCVPWELNPQPLRCQRNALTTEPQEFFSF